MVAVPNRIVDKRCQVTVGVIGYGTSQSWYEIWEAMYMVVDLCLRTHRKGGKAIGLGKT